MNTTTAYAVFINALTLIRGLTGDGLRMDVDAVPLFRWQRHTDTQTTLHDEAVVHARKPSDVLRALCSLPPGKEHYITTVNDPSEMCHEYEQAGYACMFTEWLMVRPLTELLEAVNTDEVKVATLADVPRLIQNDAEDRPWIWPQTAAHPAIHSYYIWRGGQVAARAWCWQQDASTSYVSHVFTHPDHRRKGLAQQVVLRLLQDCAVRGEQWSVLASTVAGEPLYRTLGYESLGEILVFAPKMTRA